MNRPAPLALGLHAHISSRPVSGSPGGPVAGISAPSRRPREGRAHSWLPMPPQPAAGVLPESGSRRRGQSGARTALAPTRAGAGRRYARKRDRTEAGWRGERNAMEERHTDDTDKAPAKPAEKGRGAAEHDKT